MGRCPKFLAMIPAIGRMRVYLIVHNNHKNSYISTYNINVTPIHVEAAADKLPI